MILKEVLIEILKNKKTINDAVLIAEVYKKYGADTQQSFDSIVKKISNNELPQIETILRAKRSVNSRFKIKYKRLFLIKKRHEKIQRKRITRNN